MQTQNGFQSWFFSIPPFTRVYLVILLITGFGGNLGLIDPFILLFDRALVFKKFEVRVICIRWSLALETYFKFLLYWRTFIELCYVPYVYVSRFWSTVKYRLTFSSSFERNPLSCTRGDGFDAFVSFRSSRRCSWLSLLSSMGSHS